MTREPVPPLLPSGADRVERQRAWIHLARERLTTFVASSAADIDRASRDAETALQGALASGAAIEAISAELEVSTGALRAIVDGSVPLRSLHPDDRLRPA